MNWFDFIVVLSAIILYKDYNGTLEDSLNKFEERIGIRTELPDTTENVPPPYYINPREETKDDSTRNA